MPGKYFNWKLATVLVMGLIVLGVTAYGLRQWRRSGRAERGLALGNTAYKEHRWEEAARNLGRHLAVVQDDVPTLLKYADAQLNIRPLKRNNFQQAIAAYRTVLRVARDNSEAAVKLTALYLGVGMPGEAELIAKRHLGRVSDLQEDNKVGTQTNQDPELRRILAVALARQRKFDEAAAELKSIIAESPDRILAYETLGQLTEQRPENFPDPPAYWFNEAVKNNPSSALAYIIRAGFHLRSNNRTQASTDLDQAEKQDLSDTVVRLRLAREFISANALDKAEEHLAVVQTTEPANQALWQNWAEVALKSQSHAKMQKVADRGLKELSSQPWDFMPTAAELFIRSGQYDRAADCINQLRQKDIAPATTAYLEGLVADGQGRLYDAVRCWRRAMQLGNKSPRIRLALASALSRSGDSQSALRQLRTLVSEWPNSFDGHLALARRLAQTGNWAEAVQQARIAREITPQSLDAVFLYIQARIKSLAENQTQKDSPIWQNIKQQLTALENATNGALEVKLLQFQLAMQQGNFTDADVLVTELKRAHPVQIKVAMAEVGLLDAQERKDQAILVLDNIVKQFPKATEPVRYLATSLAQEGEYEKCEAVIKNALARIEQPIARRQLSLLLAQIYAQCGRRDDGYQLLNSLAQKMPNDIPITRRLLRCEQVVNNLEQAQQLVNDIKSLEGEDGWQWRYEQARILFAQDSFKDRYPQIVSLLKENLLANPDDQASRLLLARAYERAGELRLAVSTYDEALNRSPQDIRIIVPAVAALYKANEYDRADEILRRAANEKLFHPELKRWELQSHLRRGDLSSASGVLEDLLTDDPNNLAVLLSLARTKMWQNKFAEAGELMDKLKIQEPSSLPVAVAQIDLNVRQGKSAEALLLCDEIVNKFGNASAYILRARTYAMLGQNDKAQKDFEHATIIEPDNVETWSAQSDFYRSTDHLDKAIAGIQKAMSLQPDNLGICKRAIPLLLASSDRDTVRKGKNTLDKALTSNPEDIQLRLYKARSQLAEGTAPAIENAAQILQKITEDQPKLSEPWVLLAEMALRREQPIKAMDIAFRGLVHQPNDKSLLLLKARVEAERSPVLAIPTLKALREADPNDAETVVLLARTYIAAAEPEKAVNLLRKQMSSCTGTLYERKISIALAVALHKNGNTQEAQERFDSLYQSAPDDPSPLLAQAQLLKDDKLWSQLNQMVSLWCRNHPEDSRTPITIYADLATAEDSQAKKIAEDLLRRILARDPNSLPAMNTLAMLLQMTGRPAESTALYQQILTLQPDNVVAINNLAWTLCEEQGKHRQALKLAQRGLKIAPNYVDLIDTRGVIYYRLGQYDKAVQDFTRCLKLYPTGTPAAAATYVHLGRALVGLAQKDKAVENLNKALELNAEIGGLSATDTEETQRLLEELSHGS